MAKLTLGTFNNLLFSAFKDQSLEKKKGLLEKETQILLDMLYDDLFDLCDELTEKGYESELFTEIGNLKSNGETLLEQIKEIEKQIAEKEEK